jgi:hypothetical protein
MLFITGVLWPSLPGVFMLSLAFHNDGIRSPMCETSIKEWFAEFMSMLFGIYLGI